MSRHFLSLNSLLVVALGAMVDPPGYSLAQDTFSIVAVDPTTGDVGSAGASCIAGSIILSDVHPGVGAIHTQSFYHAANQAYARALMDAGHSPAEIIDSLIVNDAEGTPGVRQYGIADLVGGGRSAGFTGDDCFDYKNHSLGPTYAIAGNILLGQEILDDMEAAFNATCGPLSTKLMAALQGANVPGADTRCLPAGKPAISAFIRVAKPQDTPGSFYLDLNVNDTAVDENPIDILQTLYDDWQATTCSPDIEVPIIDCPADITVECTGPGGIPADHPSLTPFFSGVLACDLCDPDVIITNDAPAFILLGTTAVTFTATDDAGLSATCMARITVIDTTPPVLDVTLNRYQLWPPNHQLATITALVTIQDSCDPNPSFVLTSIVSDEPDAGQGDGDRPDDIQDEVTGMPDVEFRLRSERSGSGDGREYTIVYTATDAAGLITVATIIVSVPHDQSGLAAPAGGFNADGTDFDPNASTYFLVIPSTLEQDASAVVGARCFVGHHMGLLSPIGHALLDADGDQRLDLVLSYPIDSTENLQAMMGEGGICPVGLRYETTDGHGYLVPDIFALGPPLENPITAVPLVGPVANRFGRPQPNPFTYATNIAYVVGGDAKGERVEIRIFNVSGRRVRTLWSGYQPPGQYLTSWDGRNDEGTAMPAGVYFFRVTLGGDHAVRQVTLVR